MQYKLRLFDKKNNADKGLAWYENVLAILGFIASLAQLQVHLSGIVLLEQALRVVRRHSKVTARILDTLDVAFEATDAAYLVVQVAHQVVLALLYLAGPLVEVAVEAVV